MSNDIFNIGLSGLNAAQWGLQTTSQNISNAATPGYTVENPVYAEASGQYTGSGYLGTGVDTVTVQRNYSQYLSAQLNTATSTNSALTANYAMASQLSNLVGSPTTGISAAITSYFTGMQNVANTPNNVAFRQTAISAAQTLASQINAAGAQYDQLRTSVNQQLQTAVASINTYSSQIATLNGQIAAASAQGQPPNQLLDQRDQAVASLSQLVGVSVVQNSSGYSVFIGNGQPLVVASNNFKLGTANSQSDPSELSVTYNGLNGATTPPPVEYLPPSAVTGGTVGGLLQFRTQTLDPAESQLGAIATSFASQVNAQNALGIDLAGNKGGNLFNVGSPTVYSNLANTGNANLTVGFANSAQPTNDDYALSFAGGTYTLTDTTTGSVVGTSATAPNGTTPIGGLVLNITSGSMNAGDSFTIQPTRGALNTFGLTTSNPSSIAASAPVLASAPSSNTGTGSITQGTVTAGYQISGSTTIAYNSSTNTLSGFQVGTTITVAGTPPTTIPITAATTTVPYNPAQGATLTINSTTTPTPAGITNGVTFSLSGTPANGDTFTIAPNTGTFDGRNALAMSKLVSNASMNGGTSTMTAAYASYVNNIGNAASQLKAASTSQSALVTQITSAQQAVSGVNLDEEASNLLQYQQAYQANSKVIQTAESMFQTLMGIFH
ncbi:flagellar hook-associated protein FlgK [Trinickia dabaoshanensis]|uniref:Flagellar hook-associated protein 1 n=1 Tax=Trinickia dabaoshanensis TaxID=564714 RepID=A0A2N7VZB4_9BURK|nr:flagellar hook-associated protein FlgK [Trinickia dabaoshanensis]PMS22485.1 flagellar hook-associated protein FlgK [Trinickia dabaoshanensis]